MSSVQPDVNLLCSMLSHKTKIRQSNKALVCAALQSPGKLEQIINFHNSFARIKLHDMLP